MHALLIKPVETRKSASIICAIDAIEAAMHALLARRVSKTPVRSSSTGASETLGETPKS
jgi:hypothetical protein